MTNSWQRFVETRVEPWVEELASDGDTDIRYSDQPDRFARLVYRNEQVYGLRGWLELAEEFSSLDSSTREPREVGMMRAFLGLGLKQVGSDYALAAQEIAKRHIHAGPVDAAEISSAREWMDLAWQHLESATLYLEDTGELEGILKGLRRMRTDFEATDGRKSACYVATCCYGTPDHPDIAVLRRFRDEKLMRSVGGRAIVNLYYLLSPHAVTWLRHSRWLTERIRVYILAPLVNRVRPVS